ncbi:tetratricopeptide repeat protein [Leptospira levettii]|uniref:tetratricopeptide repeat protein n=1 Tax=Leptospira levettii TaxID=2023178 RepID=UPI001082D315|nr:tetratricopeptide repeat protein [Leptospira levettii]MCW7506587.1 tetratricopeptide repeat protein [Leptospira levettii]MCW7517677.1 tetratricopeptide repeat protein [Leptospira levettii]TGK93200.1 tetratricopeptide repeat protein [Leptospira levettii]
MNHLTKTFDWIAKRWFVLTIPFFLYPLCFFQTITAETPEIFLPFPETWKETNPSVTEGNTVPATVSLQTKSKDSLTPSDQNGNNTQTPTNSSVVLSNPKDQVSINASLPTSGPIQNTKVSDKKKKKKEVIDPSKASYQKGKAYLSRDQKKSAEQEFADSYNKEGDSAKYSRTENTNLFGLDGKDKESSTLVEKQEDPDLKIKTQFELARSLDRIGNPESEEKAYKEYLKLVTDFPKHPELTPRAHYAMAILLIRKKEFRSAAHQLVNVIKNFKESEEFLPSHYYLGKIYESSWEERDLERSLKYYQLYLNGIEGKNPKPGYDFRKETRERLRVLGSSI